MSHSTSAVRPSRETWSRLAGSSGERRLWTVLNGATARATSPTTARKAGSAIVERLALDHDDLGQRGRLREPSLLEDLVGAMRLADVVFCWSIVF